MINEKRLTEAITEGGIPWINFFNGRLLSGEDLSKEQQSNLKGRRRLGVALGEGVAEGLEVSSPDGVNTRDTPFVIVEAGLAINRQGQTLKLEHQTNVKLTRPINAEAEVTTGGAFDDCKPLQPGLYIAKAGVYLLTIAPASKSEGRAAVSGLDNIIARCNTHHAVEGVQFRLIQLGLNDADLSTKFLRNRVAYRCFGIDNTRPAINFPIDPLSLTSQGPTLLDDLRPRLLTDCDVPLAIINWTSAEGIKFVDRWSVRRRVSAPSASGKWEAVVDERRRSEGEAMFLQFQEHLKSIARTEPNLKTVVASEHFERLPPIGIVPVVTEASTKGFNYRSFFQDQTYREPVFIDGARFERLIRESISYPPFNLGTGELIWLYQVRHNMQTIAHGGAGASQHYLIFSSGHMPFCGEARFDVNRYNYSNYSSVDD